MAKFDPNSVEAMYRYGRTYGDSKPHDDPYPKVKASLGGATGLGPIDPKIAQPQDKESCASDRTFNDVSPRSWLRGYGDTKAMCPDFDAGPSGGRYKK